MIGAPVAPLLGVMISFFKLRLGKRLLKDTGDGRGKRRLVVLHGEHIVRFSCDDLLGDVFLAAHGIDSDETAMDLQQL